MRLPLAQPSLDLLAVSERLCFPELQLWQYEVVERVASAFGFRDDVIVRRRVRDAVAAGSWDARQNELF